MRGDGGGLREEEGKERVTRKSTDKIINKEGKLLVDKIEERGWMILNDSYDIKRGLMLEKREHLW